MNTLSQTVENRTENKFLGLLRIRNFRLFWLGEAVSVLGDHFYMVAMPWLVLRLTGDPLVMGSVLALTAVPRALLMLIGGALTDRFSPRGLMLYSNAARFILVSLLTGLTFTGAVEIWMLYVFAVLFGIADAFFYPAANSITPRLVRSEQLQSANALVHGTMMLAMLAGPALAGLLIAALGDGPVGGAPDLRGIAAALGIDALTFLVSVVSLWRIDLGRRAAHELSENILAAIRDGLVFVWRDVPLRAFFFVVAVTTFFFNGPFNVGVPLLADLRFPEGAVAYGAILSAWGGGSLLGMVFAGALPRPDEKHMGSLLLGLVGLMGIGLGSLGSAPSMIAAAAIGLVLGSLNGYINIFFLTWVQRRAPSEFTGRLMSLLAFAGSGLYPVSMALSGAFSRLDVALLLGGAGGVVALVAFVLALNPTLRTMEARNDG